MWETVETFANLPHLKPKDWNKFLQLKKSQLKYTRSEGNPNHLCSFFLPYDKERGMIYLGLHKKANDWIPPGGHIELGETPAEAAVREMEEELRVKISQDKLKPWNLSVKYIGRPEQGCEYHYDIWYLASMPMQHFDYLKSEYYDARWFTVKDGLRKITKNPDFSAIISTLI